MRRGQSGQTMPEYLVVAGALVSSFFIVENIQCPGYDNCISAVAGALHNRYQGYSNAITGVHKFYPTSPTLSLLNDGGASGDNNSGGGAIDPLEGQEGLSSQTVVNVDGGGTYLLGTDGLTVVDGDGNAVGTYEDGVFTPAAGAAAAGASLAIAVVDDKGNVVNPSVIICNGQVDSFGYVYDEVIYDTVQLQPRGNLGSCFADDYVQMARPDGEIDSLAVLYGGIYYPSYFGNPTPSGEVVLFNIDNIPDDTDKYGDFAGGSIDECVVLPNGWDADEDKDDLENYIALLDAGGVIGVPVGICDPVRQGEL